MRMAIRHVDIKEVYDKFGREWFATYSYYNLKDHANIEAYKTHNINRDAKNNIMSMVKVGYLIRESGKRIEYVKNYPDFVKGIKLDERWRLSGKALFELKDVIENSDIELTNQDYADVALDKLVR